MIVRVSIYRANAEACMHQAAFPQNASQKDQWLKLADQWMQMAEDAIRQPGRSRRVRRPSSSQIHSRPLA
jgi:hypothetical protein